MKYRSYLNLVLALAIFGGVLLLSSFERVHTLSVLATPTIHQMSPNNSNNGVVEAGGLQFQLFIANQKVDEDATSFTSVNTIQIPKRADGSYNLFYLILRISNKTDKPIYFGRYADIELYITGMDANIIAPDILYRKLYLSQYGLALANPGESINISWQGSLAWIDELLMSIAPCIGCSMDFWNLKPGKYQLKMSYSNAYDKMDFLNKAPLDNQVPDWTPYLPDKTPPDNQIPIWKGKIVFPAIDLYIAQ